MEQILQENREKFLERETDFRNQILTKEKEKEIELLKKKELERKIIEMTEFFQKKENEKTNEIQNIKNQNSSNPFMFLYHHMNSDYIIVNY